MRSKEEALDYRYFPEPDLPLLKIDDGRRKRLDDQNIVHPHTIIRQFKEYGFNKEYINALINDKSILEYFMVSIGKGSEPKLAAKRIA